MQDAYKSQNFNGEGISDGWTILNNNCENLANNLSEANIFQSNSSKEVLKNSLKQMLKIW